FLLDALDVYLHVQATHLLGGPAAAHGPRAADVAAQASYQRFIEGGRPAFSPRRAQRRGYRLAGLIVELSENAGPKRFAARLGGTLVPAAVLLATAAVPGLRQSVRTSLVVLGCMAAFLPLRVVWLKAKK